MKKLLIALGVLLLLCIIGLGIAAYSAESLVKKYKPDLEQIASDALKAPVALGDIGVSVFPSAKVAVSQLTIGKTASAPGLQLKDLLLRVNLFALLGGSLQISELSLDSPSIVLRKDSSGAFRSRA